ncbi:DUF1641 domain-containing protein [Bacillus sp. USDA818B3_A]|uniref:DUF1641 domain-containing protein n=1 Tax=Bacillus sp. USDA818B3_A TaxID=2698834 RepID=UPI0013708A89|nr:DUF1641 domain-containing protein [Bacillus sp. USDA818B3_A]
MPGLTVTSPHAEEAVKARSMEEQIDLLDQLLKPDVQQSLTILVENLPKLTEMVNALTKTYDVAQSIITDRLLVDDFVTGIQAFVKPVEVKMKQYAAAAIEANDRADDNTEATIGVFGLIKMLKDPQVQKMLRFGQAYLNILTEKQK